MLGRHIRADGALVLLAGLLVGCSAAGGAAKVGDAQKVELDGGNTIEATVTSVEAQDSSVLEGLELNAEQAAKTPVFVNYSLKLVEGSVPPGDPTFGVTHWGATDENDAMIGPVSVFGDFTQCSPTDSAAAKEMQPGDSLDGCILFLTPGDPIRTVSFFSLDWAVPASSE